MHLQFYNNTSQDYRLHRRLQSGIITLLSSSPYYRIMVPIYNLAYLIIELLFKCVGCYLKDAPAANAAFFLPKRRPIIVSSRLTIDQIFIDHVLDI